MTSSQSASPSSCYCKRAASAAVGQANMLWKHPASNCPTASKVGRPHRICRQSSGCNHWEQEGQALTHQHAAVDLAQPQLERAGVEHRPAAQQGGAVLHTMLLQGGWHTWRAVRRRRTQRHARPSRARLQRILATSAARAQPLSGTTTAHGRHKRCAVIHPSIASRTCRPP